MGLTPEGKIKARVRRLLEAHKIYHFMPATGGYGRSGVPDIIGCIRGKFFSVECKASPDKKLTLLQQKEINRIRDAGGHAFVVSNDISLSFLETWIVAVMTVPSRKEG